ncbi:MAG: SGNH/GDSL hydrolase family protein [Pirellulales bacterium]
MRTERAAGKNMLLASMFAVVCVLAWLDNPALGVEPSRAEADRFARWEAAMQEFEQQDVARPPSPGGIVFVGSSSIRLWNLNKWFHDLAPPPVNRGFGGSQIADATHFADRLVLEHKPRTVVFYSGDNDIAAGRSPEQVADDFAQFCEVVHRTLPETRVVFISIKPSPSRWKLAKEAQTANDRIRDLCKGNERLVYVDVWAAMLGEDGQPRAELFEKDMLHLNAVGYELWTKLVRPTLGN